MTNDISAVKVENNNLSNHEMLSVEIKQAKMIPYDLGKGI